MNAIAMRQSSKREKVDKRAIAPPTSTLGHEYEPHDRTRQLRSASRKAKLSRGGW